MERLLIIRLSAIGDVIRVLPAFESLWRAFPGVQFEWVVESQCADILTGHPGLSTIWRIERNKGIVERVRSYMSLLSALRREKYDVVLDFHGVIKSGLIVHGVKAERKIGFPPPRAKEGSWWFYNERCVLPDTVENRITENFRLVDQIGIVERSFGATLVIPRELRDEVRDYILENFDRGKRLVALHLPVARPEKQWPTEYARELIRLLLRDGRFQVVLPWGPGQRQVVEEISIGSERGVRLAPAMESLKEYAALLSYADVFCGPDTGPMHLAALCGVPVVCLFGGTDPRRHAPILTRHVVLDGAPERVTERERERRGGEFMRRISPECVYDAIVSLVCGTVSRG